MTPVQCAHEGRPCSPVVGDCLCDCPNCSARRDAHGSDPDKWCATCRRRGYASAACWAAGAWPIGPRTDEDHATLARELRNAKARAAALDAEPELCVIDGSPIDPESRLCLLSCQDADREQFLAEGNPPWHDCPKEAFLDDPITRASGMGSEMVGLIDCAVCDARERGE